MPLFFKNLKFKNNSRTHIKCAYHLTLKQNTVFVVTGADSENNIYARSYYEIRTTYPSLVHYFNTMGSDKVKWCHAFRRHLKHLGTEGTQRGERKHQSYYYISLNCNKTTSVSTLITTLRNYVVKTNSKLMNPKQASQWIFWMCLVLIRLILMRFWNTWNFIFPNFCFPCVSEQLGDHYLYNVVCDSDTDNSLTFTVSIRDQYITEWIPCLTNTVYTRRNWRFLHSECGTNEKNTN